jgi:hypothetical protein
MVEYLTFFYRFAFLTNHNAEFYSRDNVLTDPLRDNDGFARTDNGTVRRKPL